jgi:hypothetical protein
VVAHAADSHHEVSGGGKTEGIYELFRTIRTIYTDILIKIDNIADTCNLTLVKGKKWDKRI